MPGSTAPLATVGDTNARSALIAIAAVSAATSATFDAAATKPFGFMKFTPGPGIGGHCIPLDPHYLAWKMRSLNYKTRFIDLASEVKIGRAHV